MAARTKKLAMLSPYRVLDLTDEKGLFCGKLLGDLGADVIKIERPGGDPARRIGPFYHDDADPEKSLFWWAFNTNKMGITLDIETKDGQEIFKKLLRNADFVIESFPPGYMDNLGLGYSALEKLNPRIIMVSITPFGQTGPYKDYKATDIVAWAMGGYMYPFGDTDRSPVRIGHHSQAYLHASGEAAVGAMLALHHRERMGEGQHVDVSIQECVARLDLTPGWDMIQVFLRRGEPAASKIKQRYYWPCKDGHVVWHYWAGPAAKFWTLPFVKWMEEEGMADDFLKGVDWPTLDATTDEGARHVQEILNRVEEPTRKFFMAHTKHELHEEAVKRRLMIYPVSTVADLLSSRQLDSRGFWVEVEHPELETTITYPGAFTHASEAPPKISRRAPLIGEQNQVVYEKELGIASDELLALKQAGVI